MKKTTLIIIFLIILVDPLWAQTSWEIAQGPSSIKFKVNHLIFTTVEGKFKDFNGEVVTSNDHSLADSQMEAKIEVGSINTGNQDRDKHLNSEDFFYAEKFPEIIFRSKSVEMTENNTYKIIGEISIRGVTKTIELVGQSSDIRQLSDGRIRMDLTATGKLNRYDFGLKWNDIMETGKALVGENVELSLKLALTSSPQRIARAEIPRFNTEQ